MCAETTLHADETVLPELATRFRIDLPDLLDRHDMDWPEGPPADWKRGAPLGNGDFGAVVYGFPDALSFVIGKTDVWDRRNDERSWFVGQDFAELRQTYENQDRHAWNRLVHEAAAARPRELPHQTTCGTLRLGIDTGVSAKACAMKVSLREGIAELTWTTRKVRMLVSRAFAVLAVEINRGCEDLGECDPTRNLYAPERPLTELPWEFLRGVGDGNPPMRWDRVGDAFLGTQSFAAGGGFVVGLRIVPVTTTSHAAFTGRIVGQTSNVTAQRLTVLLTVVSFGSLADQLDTPTAKTLALDRLDRAANAGMQEIARQHIAWWCDYWMRGLCTTTDLAVEKWYFRSLYLVGSTIEPGRQAPGLQGVWCGENHTMWCGDYHANINAQCVFWGLLTNNRINMLEPFLRLYEGFANNAREDARTYFNIRGLRFPLAGSIGGHEIVSSKAAALGTDVSASAWIAQLFWQAYEYTGDRAVLQRVYPILRDVALALTDSLTRNAEGLWSIDPCVHFEASNPAFGQWGRNSSFANAMFRMGLANAIAAAQALQTDPVHLAEWRDVLAHMAPPPTTEDGAWKQWENHPPVFGGHNFWLPAVFPCELVSAWHGPEAWRQAARRTWAKIQRLPGEPGTDVSTGSAWCGGQGICEVMRVGDAQHAWTKARWSNTDQENGFIHVYEQGFIQADHGPGMCRVLADAMLMAPGGVVRLFAGVPAGFPARFHSLRAPGGFLISAERRACEVDYVQVLATTNGVLRLANPWPGSAAQANANGEVLLQGEVLQIPLGAGSSCTLTREGRRIEDLPVTAFALAQQQ